MNHYNKTFLNKKEPFLILLVFFFLLGIFSCKNEKKEPSNSEPPKVQSSDTVKQAAVILATKFPRFRIDTTALPKVVANKPSKFIIKYEIGNINDPINSMNLLLYPAQNHAHYGKHTIPVITTHSGDTTLNIVNVVLGNNELPTNGLLTTPPHPEYFFDHLIFTPTIVTGLDNKQHLVFRVEAFDKNGNPKFKPGGVVITVINNTNPSPPADPAL